MAIKNAVKNLILADQHEKLCEVISKFKGTFRIKLDSDRPENFDLMVIKLKPDSKPVRVEARRYSQPQHEFSRKKIKSYEYLRIFNRNNTSSLMCAPLIFTKDSLEMNRLTVDLRPLNNQTVRHVWSTPNLELAHIALVHSKCYP